MYPNNLVPAANIRALLRIGLLEAKRCFAKCWKDKKKYVDFLSGLMDWRLYELWRKYLKKQAGQVLGHMVKILQLFGELQRNSGFDGMKC